MNWAVCFPNGNVKYVSSENLATKMVPNMGGIFSRDERKDIFDNPKLLFEFFLKICGGDWIYYENEWRSKESFETRAWYELVDKCKVVLQPHITTCKRRSQNYKNSVTM
jgi:phage pi2 protein 07